MAKSIYEILVQIEGNEQAKQALEGIGKAAGLTGAALLAFSGAAAKAAAGYETSLAAISTLATDATGSTKEFDAALYQLSADMNGSISVTEAATAAYDILSSGYSNQADVLAILRESQKTAIGGFSDLATVSDASTTIMNAFGDALGENLSVTEKVKLVTDGMIATQDLGKITAGQYANQIGNIASTAAAAGVSLQEINAAVSVATAQGVKVESTFAGLGQVLAAIMKPTSEAVTKAKELGIEFDATALKTMGLQGVLQQLVDNGQATAENMTMLFGSVEAVKVLMPLVSNDAAAFNSALEQMGNTAGKVDKAFGTMSDTTEQRVQSAMKTLNNSLIKLGQGVVIAIEPAIKGLAFLAENFAKLPTPIQQTIGVLILASGGILTLAGGIVIATTAWASFSTSMAVVLPMLTTAIPALAGVNLSLGSLAVGIGGVGSAIAVAMPYVIAIGAAIAAIVAATKKWQALQAEIDKGDMYVGALSATEDEVARVEKVVGAIRRTGEALPKAEFEAFVEELKATDNGTGTLTKHIEVLTRAQNEATPAAEDLVEATTDLGSSTKALSEEEEKAAKKREEGLLQIQEAIATRKEDLALDKAKSAELDKITQATEAQTNAIKKKTEAEIEAINSSRELTKAEQEKAFETESAGMGQAFEASTRASDRQFNQEIEALKTTAQQQRDARAYAETSQIEALKDARALARQDAERRLADEIDARKKAQSENFALAGERLAQSEQLAVAETEQERAELREKFEEQRRIRDRIAAMDLANQVFDESKLVSLAQQLSGVSSIKSEEDARKVQSTLAQLEAEQRKQQEAADKAAQEALVAEQRAADLALEAELETRELAFAESQKALDRQFEAEIEARKLAFEDTQRAAELAHESAMEARKEAFNQQQRNLDIEAAQQIEQIRSGSESAITGIQQQGNLQRGAVEARFDQASFDRQIQKQTQALEGNTKSVVQQTSNSAQNVAATKGVQQLSQQQLQTQTELSSNAKNYLQLQINELQKLNTTNSSILSRVTAISGQIGALPAQIAASMPRPTPTPVATR